MPNGGVDLEGMFRTGNRWVWVARLMAFAGFFVLVFVIGILSVSGLNGTLWGLWISIVWLNIAMVVFTFGAQSQNEAVYLALRGTRDDSQFTEKILKRIDRYKGAGLIKDDDRKKESS